MQVDDFMLTEAFRDLHGSRLHGFAILVSLGETRTAEQVAGEALAAGAERADTLRHPERAAAWLRARALRGLHQGLSRSASTPGPARREALAALGVDPAAYEGLAALSIEGRAALVASAIERFEPIDIETILGASPAAARRMIAEALDRYQMAVAMADLPGVERNAPRSQSDGKLAKRVKSVAARAMSTRLESR